MLRSSVLTSTPIKVAFAISGALLALTAGLAVTCFAKVFAMGFLGMARSDGAATATESDPGTRAPLTLLATMCVILGVLPTYIIPVIDRAVAPLSHQSATAALVPPFFSADAQRQENLPASFLSEFHDLGAQTGSSLPGRGLVVLHRGAEHNPVVFAMSTSYMVVALAGVIGLSFIIFRLLTRHRIVMRGAAWDGGLRHLSREITYSATGFSNPVRVIFGAVLHPTGGEDSVEAVAQHFRTAIRREEAESHIVDRLVLGPPVIALRWLAAIVRKMHVGHVNAYAAYVLAALLLVLLIGARIF
jgi:hydrogenase-4 component B